MYKSCQENGQKRVEKVVQKIISKEVGQMDEKLVSEWSKILEEKGSKKMNKNAFEKLVQKMIDKVVETQLVNKWSKAGKWVKTDRKNGYTNVQHEFEKQIEIYNKGRIKFLHDVKRWHSKKQIYEIGNWQNWKLVNLMTSRNLPTGNSVYRLAARKVWLKFQLIAKTIVPLLYLLVLSLDLFLIEFVRRIGGLPETIELG